jgi:hypothetical protein
MPHHRPKAACQPPPIKPLFDPLRVAPLGDYHPGDRCAWCSLLDSETELRITVLIATRAEATVCVDGIACLRRARRPEGFVKSVDSRSQAVDNRTLMLLLTSKSLEKPLAGMSRKRGTEMHTRMKSRAVSAAQRRPRTSFPNRRAALEGKQHERRRPDPS